LAEKVPLRSLLPAVVAFYPKAVKVGPNAIEFLFTLVGHIMKSSSRDNIVPQIKDLMKFFLQSFDYRQQAGKGNFQVL
jgi:hypothetical protein